MSSGCCASVAKSAYRAKHVGKRFTLDYRVFIEECASGKIISPFHDIPLQATSSDDASAAASGPRVFNMVCEIPRWSNAKLEIATAERMTPIKQDTKKGLLRFIRNVFPHRGYMWNYGALPQTWENPSHVDSNTGCRGDNDPIDAIEIGSKIATIGQVKQVKVLGVLGLIDDGETDWKIIVIDINDPLASSLHDIEDVERVMPGYLDATRHWFRVYKMPDGKPANKFAFDGETRNRAFAEGLIDQTHEQWKSLVAGEHTASGCQLSIARGPCCASELAGVADAKDVAEEAPVDDSVLAWTFVRE